MTTFTYAKTVSLTGFATTNGSPNVTLANSAAGSWAVVIGAVVAHPNLPVGSTIIDIPTTTSAVLDRNATATGTGLTATGTNPDTIRIDQVPPALKVGGDIYNINGLKLLMDQDSRYGYRAGTQGAFGSVVISSTLGGSLAIDSRKVRAILFFLGAGTIPLDTQVTMVTQVGSGASAQFVGVFTDLSAAMNTPGTAMPASGYIKVRNWNGIPFNGQAWLTIAGCAAAAWQPDVPGWIDIAADELASVTVPRLGDLTITGDWWIVGTTTGNNLQYWKLPTAGLNVYLPGVWVEKTIGSEDYEFYPNMGTVLNSSPIYTGTDPVRGKVCWINTSGHVMFKHDGSFSGGGYVPPVGLKIRIPNIFMHNCTTALRSQNALPHATIASRYRTITTGGGNIKIDKASVGWYLNMASAFSVALDDVSTFSNITVGSVATPMVWNQVGVGQEANMSTTSLVVTSCFAGATINDLTLTRISNTTGFVYTLTDITNFTFNRLKTWTLVLRTSTGGCGSITRASNLGINRLIQGGGRLALTNCNDVKINDVTYFDHQAELNCVAANPQYMFDLVTKCQNVTIDGIDFGGMFMNQPYSGILLISAAGCDNIRLRNLGTYDEPLSLGSPRRDFVAWTRVTTTATVTSPAHGYAVGDNFYVVVCSDIAAITVASKTVLAVPTADTFTFTCLSAGAASGTLSYFGTKAANLVVFAASAAANNVKIQRCYTPHTRTNLFTADITSKNITFENVFSDYINAPLLSMNNLYYNNVSGTLPMTAQNTVYGTHWWNGYVCDVAENTVDQPWTRVTTTATVVSENHRLRTGMTISVITTSAPTGVTLGYRNVTVLSANTFTFVCLSAGAASGTLSYRVGNGRIGLSMNESTTETASHYTMEAGNPRFTSTGGLRMLDVGDQMTFVTPIYIKGQGSSFPVIEAVMAGGTIGNYDIAYSLDRNDGNGYGEFKNLYLARAGGSGTSGQFTFNVTDATDINIGDYAWGTNIGPNARVTNKVSNTLTADIANVGTVSGIIRFNGLPSETDLGPDTGIKMKWRIKTMIANASAITSLYINSESTTLGRSYQYALDVGTVQVKGLVSGSSVQARRVDTGQLLASGSESSGVFTFETEYMGDIIVEARKASSEPYYIPWPTQITPISGETIAVTALQQLD